MNTIKYIYIIMISLLLVSLSSCEIAKDLDEYEPNFALPAEGAITNGETAELALAGVYAGFRQRSAGGGNPDLYLLPSVLSGTMERSPFSRNPDILSWQQNNPDVTGTTNLGAYTRMYDLINRANWLLQEIDNAPADSFSSETRKAEVIAETKALRATAHLYLLRLWGQFYDTNSEYGIVIKTEPSLSDEVFPRNTVAETYAAIIADLDDAIADAPDLRAKYYTNKTYAKGLKAKVLLYMGDYAGAATLAKDVLDNSGASFALAPTYQEIFLDHTTPALFESTEVVFGSRGAPGEGLGIGNFTDFAYALGAGFIDFGAGSWQIGSQNITYDSDRISSMVTLAFGFIPDTRKYTTREPGQDYEMIYHLRMAEVYLIYAEADARANGSVSSDALDALNTVRLRAGATTTGGDGFETYPATITYDQFIEAVRLEKYVELGGESGEEWFDLVRYHFVDGFDVTTVKPSATDPDKYILPINQNNIEVGGNIVVQNPSY
ncbi:RagB/SusD family nutrient uptake outer membrane protein [Seonamhaeicola sp.]|uniref:RagB/SusD family nutrient uptake outer membrane protein n=1 Tax=Seonamhaeicola sp. TaxID=1912245 RepID=UPI002602DFB1|nr:RagB/SusD family nutrient uptake outer membrane protein [Seonamhaeicola sp.]